jgi:hypothetical protein
MPVIPSEVEGSRCVTLKVSCRDPSVRAGLGFFGGMAEEVPERSGQASRRGLDFDWRADFDLIVE